jgi:hypothetical protein
MNIPVDHLKDLLGAENAEELKKRIVNDIASRIRSDINNWDEYVFYPPDFQEFFDECFKEAQAMVKETIVNKLYNDMMNAYKGGNNNGN